MVLKSEKLTIEADFKSGVISSLVIGGEQRLADTAPLFGIRLRDREIPRFAAPL